jgi:HSP20 family molecular chaperone IbpA
MWSEACAFIERVENLQRQYFEPHFSDSLQARWKPPIDIFETDVDIVVVAALPGVTLENLEILVEDETVVIRGEQRLPQVAHRALIHRLEIPYGRFERRLSIPHHGSPLADPNSRMGSWY